MSQSQLLSRMGASTLTCKCSLQVQGMQTHVSSSGRFLVWNVVCFRAATRAADPLRVRGSISTGPSTARLLVRTTTPSFKRAPMLQQTKETRIYTCSVWQHGKMAAILCRSHLKYFKPGINRSKAWTSLLPTILFWKAASKLTSAS